MASTQTSTTGNLQSMSRIMLSKARYTEEHNMPVVQLIDKFSLPKGHYQLDIPKVAQMNAGDLVDGQDLIDSEEITPTIVSATAAEVGIKVVITDRLLRQNNESVFSIIGRQMGDAMARKKDTDAIALFSGFTDTYGGDKVITFALATGLIANAKENKYGNPLFAVHHPNVIWKLAADVGNIVTSYPLPDVFNKPAVKDYYSGVKIAGVPFFEDGNIAAVSGQTYGYGVIAHSSAMGYLVASAKTERRQRDESLRATEVIIVEEYGMFEADDDRAGTLQYTQSSIST